ncbi:EAL domain-containing protein [Amphibacillus sediminis]|uniref:EAL domain-containing protein n=1 Tax=Amphibacillus sediminis TaxID=360185 RepID=UPI00082CC0A7|nr:EAL domain-containing protein [Amphibacillus sediminis]
MDALEVLEKIDLIKPAFQPIISAVTHKVAGYELFAQLVEEGESKSLEHFFLDEEVPDEIKLEVDQSVLKLALAEIQQDDSTFLCISRTAQELFIKDGEPLLELLNTFNDNGFPPQRIVLQITEQDLEQYYNQLYHLLLYYKNCGIQIAIDQLGNKTSNLDRIRQLEPNILKINTRVIGSYEAEGYDDIMYSFEMLAERIGAALLFEDIEDDFLQYFAWKHGGRYYQGYYLADLHLERLEKVRMNVNVPEVTSMFVNRQKEIVEHRLELILDWEQRLTELTESWNSLDEIVTFLTKAGQLFDSESFRIYICDSNGRQVSPNYHKKDNHWVIEEGYQGSNWAFRPYFLTNIMEIQHWNRAMLSGLYADIETRERIRTLSFPLPNHYFIFIDMSYRFLYENDCLLS